MLTPGFLFILRGIARIFILSIISLGAGYFIETLLGFTVVPRHLTAVAVALAVPTLIAARITWVYHAQRRRAFALGAAPVPVWSGKWPGSVDLLVFLMGRFERGYPGEGFWEAIEEFGPIFNLRVLWQNTIFTTQPEHIKAILATDFGGYEKGSRFHEIMESVLGTGVFNSDGDMWKFHRSMTRPFFSRDRVTHFDIFERHADDAITAMKSRLRSGYSIDFQDVMSRFTLDSATEFLFGKCVHALQSRLPYPHGMKPAGDTERTQADIFAEAFGEAQYVIAFRSRQGDTWPLFEMFKDATKAPMKIVHAYLNPILREGIERQEKAELEGKVHEGKIDEIDEDETLLDHLVKHTKDLTIIKDEILNIMIAGRDTTAATLTFAIYALAMYPHILKKLRAEVMAKVGPTRRLTYDDIRDMKYLRAFINETLRVFPPVPFNVRDTINETTLSPTTEGGKPSYIPPASIVTYSVFLMHRRTDLWGPDALEFDPDRFLDERLHKYLTPNPFIFLPFNAGPRICLGQQFAYNETSFMLVKLLQNFDSVTLDESAQPPDSRIPPEWANVAGRQSVERFFPKMHLTMYAHKGLWVKMREASSDPSSL
ncbi:cytochrome P450 [Rickenella mellea]|uniref:Cytochrome P450 n=1 Tax=Rickenella mellea TaxID=50990 RepID=A0A4Y7PZ31_9AGAM|nr:cytochrome P450 [Rickenella mellea]